MVPKMPFMRSPARLASTAGSISVSSLEKQFGKTPGEYAGTK
jgi:hypothetical protein